MKSFRTIAEKKEDEGDYFILVAALVQAATTCVRMGFSKTEQKELSRAVEMLSNFERDHKIKE